MLLRKGQEINLLSDLEVFDLTCLFFFCLFLFPFKVYDRCSSASGGQSCNVQVVFIELIIHVLL